MTFSLRYTPKKQPQQKAHPVNISKSPSPPILKLDLLISDAITSNSPKPSAPFPIIDLPNKKDSKQTRAPLKDLTNKGQHKKRDFLKTTPYRHKRRKIVKTDLSRHGRPVGAALKEALRHHAKARFLLVFLVLLAFENIGVNDKGKPVIRVDRARRQGGRAKRGYHAAHIFIAGGLFDKIIWQKICELVEKNKHASISSQIFMSPQTKRVFRSKGLKSPQIKRILQNIHDKEKICEIVAKTWGNPSLFQGTRIQTKVQSTTNVPRRVNIVLDKRLENLVREKFFIDLVSNCYLGKITADQGVAAFIAKACSHYGSEIKRLQEDENSKPNDLRHLKILYDASKEMIGHEYSISEGVSTPKSRREKQDYLLSTGSFDTKPKDSPKKRRQRRRSRFTIRKRNPRSRKS